jgi:hypothetical protein
MSPRLRQRLVRHEKTDELALLRFSEGHHGFAVSSESLRSARSPAYARIRGTRHNPIRRSGAVSRTSKELKSMCSCHGSKDRQQTECEQDDMHKMKQAKSFITIGGRLLVEPAM